MKYRSCPFGFPWVSLGCLWADIGLALAPFNPFGLHLAVLWAPFGPFASLWGGPGLPLAILWAHLAGLWNHFGALWEPVISLGPGPPLQTSSSMFTVCDACAQNQASWNTPPEPRESAGATGTGEVVSRTAARSPPPTRAGGQDDGSYTNSLKKIRT